MATMGISPVKSQNVSQGFTTVLTSAFFEWLLMFMLFIDGIFSYLVTKFARSCELQAPCLLCSRLDRVLGKEKLGFYWDLICHNHKLEISSLVLCYTHKKLVNGRGMCENCLFSFATINKYNAETYRLLVGKLGEDTNSVLDHDPILEEYKPSSSSTRHCSCCSKPYIPSESDKRLFQTKSIESEAAELDLSLSGAVEHSHEGLKKKQYIPSGSVGAPQLGNAMPQVRSNAIKLNGTASEAPTAAIGHGLEELDWQKLEHKVDPSVLPALTHTDDTPASFNSVETPVELSKQVLDDAEASEVPQTSVAEKGEISKTGSGPITGGVIGSEINPMLVDTVHQMPNSLDLGDAYRLAVSNRGRQSSGILADQRTGKDSAKVSGEFKVLLSQMSATRGFELPLNDISPRVSGNVDDLKTFDSSTPTGLHILQKRISLERNESGLSLDGSIVSEIEGESMVDRLKRQVEHDRKTIIALYKELDEERNASAISANQAMAMITRLQEEKAALHMEALQYLRMMEEQSEYDMEALQKTNDLLTEKEKEMQDLEAELEFYRKKFPDETMLENTLQPTCDPKIEDVRMEHSDASCVGNDVDVPSNVVMVKPKICDNVERKEMSFNDKHMSIMKNSLLEIEEERLYISECLKILEVKLRLFSNDGACSNLANGEYSGNGVSDSKELNHKEGSQEDGGMEETDLPVQNDISVSRGSPHAGGSFALSQNSQFVGKESGQSSSIFCRENDLIALGNEISHLNDRLESLEADRDFLEHSVNSLRNGDEGLQFIQQIASDLQELRKIGIRRRNQTVS
ncbi:myosin-binding protein 1 isoform X2 [Vitis vinifera]|uniref:myosin-binding protein 1 isoform X2 n=1 Tax=Vitis vinifera TaxID=29760 RepID=UPI0005402D64|nr:myosin-binding protein 1 isoform X2 [Vitis vinifera]XP_059598491.1 myosin-binding protein 1 isoform X2 [Vitis vinifera]|eukprot:XP_010660132.1 PREDICTED: myosin-binding protein 1 isoform X2 [Vitis vinifera]